ncbi:MAG: hypothetical protein KKH94_08465 [Candidatus Omnitrophica bacterium]|nr:hypothetical protein [Candidatus Omnitrophota bacterium]
MFKNLLSFWKGKDFLSKVLNEFEQMMINAEGMFKAVCEKLITGKGKEGLGDRIYEIDRQINQFERDIRKRIIEHLALQPSVDVPVCLVLMSVVKDAERLGDYAKNLFEVTEMMKGPMDKELFRSYFNEADKKLILLAEKTRSAFIKSDEALAREILGIEREIVVKCEEAIKKLANGNLSSNLSVCFTLIARYFKRIAAHLVNIGSSVIVPIDQLDFFDESERQKNMKSTS